MTRRILLFCFSLFLLSACLRPASDSAPTELPLNFPSPAPGTTPLCQSADLQTSSNSIDTGEALVLGLTLTNSTNNPCALVNPPQVTLLDASHQPLNLQTVDMSPVQTPPAPVEVILAPGENLIISLTWSNACEPLLKQDLSLRLTLSGQSSLETATKISFGPRCKPKNGASTLTIAPYSYPP